MLKTYLFLTICALALVSCSSNDEPVFVPEQDTDFAIVPHVGMGNLSASRGGGVVLPSDTTSRGVSVFRVDQYDNSGTVEYPSAFSAVSAPYLALLSGSTTGGSLPEGVSAATIAFDAVNRQYFLANGWKTKVLSVYPRIVSGDWNSTNNEITYTISAGNTDVMATAWCEGYKDLSVNPAQSVQPQNMNYNHLLTQVQVRVYAADEVGRQAWGNIKRVSIGGLYPTVKVALPAISSASTVYPTLTASGTPAAVAVTAKDGTAATALAEANVPLYDAEANPTVTPAVFGYCMFAPIASSTALPLTIVTEKNSVETTTNISVAAQAYAAATAYIVTLRLTSHAIIPGAVTIAEWTSQEIDEIEI